MNKVKYLLSFSYFRYLFLIMTLGGCMISSKTIAANDPESIKVDVIVGTHTLNATFINNETTKALISKFPLTLSMMDLYSREMCYRFKESLPANEVGTRGYAVGDIVYWTPRHSFVIMYEQNGEVISNLQKIGHIDSGVELFKTTGDTDVTFKLHEQ